MVVTLSAFKRLVLVGAFLSELAWLEYNMIEPEFCHQMGPYRSESSPASPGQESALQYS